MAPAVPATATERFKLDSASKVLVIGIGIGNYSASCIPPGAGRIFGDISSAPIFEQETAVDACRSRKVAYPNANALQSAKWT